MSDEDYPQARSVHPTATDSTKVAVIYAGGTISSLAVAGGYREGGHKVDLFAVLERRFPGTLSHITIQSTEFAYLGLSENMTHDYWQQIAAKVKRALKHSPEAIIISHGTDTIEHTARFLHDTFGEELRRRHLPIIMTGANRDLAHPATDAWDNLRFSLECAEQKVEPHVYVAFHGELIPATEVIKEPFDGQEMNLISRRSQRYQELMEQHRLREKTLLKKLAAFAASAGGRSAGYNHTSESNTRPVIQYAVNRVLRNHDELGQLLTPQTKVIVLTLYHSGTAHTEDPSLSVANLVISLRQEKGIIFFGVTETGEPLDLHAYETSVALLQAGVVPLYDIPARVAVQKAKLLSDLSPAALITAMLTDVVGEMKQRPIQTDVKHLLRLYEDRRA